MALEETNDKLVFKMDAQEAQIAGLQGLCAYLSKYLMKFDSWPKKKETPLAIKDKESTSKIHEEDPKEQEVSKTTEKDTPIEGSNEEPIDTIVKRR
jgi:hypothetical protein